MVTVWFNYNWVHKFDDATTSIWFQGWGKTIVLGVDEPGAVLSLSSFDILFHGKSLMGSLYGGLKPKSDVPTLLKWYTDKVTYYCLLLWISYTSYHLFSVNDFRESSNCQKLELDKFVTHEVGFEDINEAFKMFIEGKCLRCVIWMKKIWAATSSGCVVYLSIIDFYQETSLHVPCVFILNVCIRLYFYTRSVCDPKFWKNCFDVVIKTTHTTRMKNGMEIRDKTNQ